MNLTPYRARSTLRRGALEARFALSLRALPPRVAWFHWRARRVAQRARDDFSLASATRPHDLAILLSLSHNRERVAELGTATGWTALSLALASPRRRVWSYDPAARAEVDRYRQLVGRGVRSRVEFVTAAGSAGPPAGVTIELLYVDSSHDRDDTIAEIKAWAPALEPGALIVFDDYQHPLFPGVRSAVEALGLTGRQRGTLFVHEVRG
jgi:predicted O-methyltransferase YrrM